ncbi:MAG: hypothetical protein E7267_07800 [Lachnospiraceae bacterium]|nr:hypothetical protein [Lachnospiraceae bacterium]
MKKILTRFAILLTAMFSIILVSKDSSANGGINNNEAKVISVVTGGFSYNNEIYVARQEYVNQLIAYLNRPDINITAEQADKAINTIYSNIETGVTEGYIVKKDSDKNNLKDDNSVEISEISPEQEKEGITDLESIGKATPEPGKIVYNEEGSANIYNSEGKNLGNIDGVLKNTGFSYYRVYISLLIMGVLFVSVIILSSVLLVRERKCRYE